MISVYNVIEWEMGKGITTMPCVVIASRGIETSKEYINNRVCELMDAGYELNEKDTAEHEYIALDYLTNDGEIITRYIRIQEVKIED